MLVAVSLLSFGAPFAWARGPDLFDAARSYGVAAFHVVRDAAPKLVAFALPSSATPALVARSVPVCSSGDRARRKATCLVDGDTGWHDGMKWRTAGIDTPEIDHAACPSERQLAIGCVN